MSDPAADLGRLRIDRDAPRPAPRVSGRVLLVSGIVAFVALGAILVARRSGAVAVETVVAMPLDSDAAAPGAAVTANGYVVARTRAAVSAKVAGRLAALTVSEGSVVREGQVIARLQNADYQAAVVQAQANVATARAELLEAESDRDQARRDARRMLSIQAQNPQLLSRQDVEAAESRATQAEARAAAAAARVQAARAGLQFAEANLENTYIRAPFTGTVLRKEAEVGEVVAPSVGGGLTRGAVVTLADLRTLEVEVDVNEAYIGRIHHGQTARITLDAYQDTSFRGVVRQIVPTADRQRATIQVKVEIVDRDPRILPEMGARVDFLGVAPGTTAVRAGPPRFRVPAAAVREHQGNTIVWVVRDGRLEARTVETGPVSGGFREVRSGLVGGELLVTGGVDEPKAGMRVK